MIMKKVCIFVSLPMFQVVRENFHSVAVKDDTSCTITL